jgi:hydrogenase maturation protein HypF
MHVAVRGAVQGVGFRPFVYRLATEMRLRGWVNNSPQGVFLEVEGPDTVVHTFLTRLEAEKPPRASIRSVEPMTLEPAGYDDFVIRNSNQDGCRTALVLPDIATCPDCLAEILDPENRRFRYPFTNCTNCGPRYSIIEALPYDRPNTTMRGFVMCERCREEYENPRDRRFHAQPNACPNCGPHLELWDAKGVVRGTHEEALLGATTAIQRGSVVAVKGIGGFHLIVDACDQTAVRRLRRRKHREEKPLALMFPSLDHVRSECDVSDPEERLLLSPEAPIVLLRRHIAGGSIIAEGVAPHNPYLGAMLPYSPLHHLLMAELGFPVVATSGNLSDEPICTDEREALERLKGIADFYLVHNRPITRNVDDSVVRVLMGHEMVVRRARGYAPLPVTLPEDSAPVLAVGAHLKNTVAVAIGSEAFISQHIGDLETTQANSAFQRVVSDLLRLYEVQPEIVACDEHPDYVSTHFAHSMGIPVVSVQHHYAHVLSCMADNGLTAPALGVAWDGTGYGPDGTVWGGEFLAIDGSGYKRIAHFRTFRLPGGDKAVKEPRRSAFGLLFEGFGDRITEFDDIPAVRSFSRADRETLATMLRSGINAPRTSSVGRLFDAVASLCGLRHEDKFEGQAAIELEFALDGASAGERYEFGIVPATDDNPIIVDWAPVLDDILVDVRAGVRPRTISVRFHNALVETVASVAALAGIHNVVLSGGCFQNAYLLEHSVRRLENEGFQPFWHRQVPPNDGGISLGQVSAVRRARKETLPCASPSPGR